MTVVLTVALVGSGVLAYNGPRSLHALALNVHKVSFYPLLVAIVAHVVPHFLEAVSQAVADLLGRAGLRVPGATPRRALVLGALALGAILAVAFSGRTGSYLVRGRHGPLELVDAEALARLLRIDEPATPVVPKQPVDA